MRALLLLIPCIHATQLVVPTVSVSRDPATTLIIWGTRHGNRNPGAYIVPDAERTWGHEGPNELTEIGERQAAAFGRALRTFSSGMLTGAAGETDYYTSSANRTKFTLEAVVRAFSPNASTVPVTINDSLLRAYSLTDCPAVVNAWRAINDESLYNMRASRRQNAAVLEYVATNTGWNNTLEQAANVADNLLQIAFFNASYPSWIESPTLDGYNKSRLVQEILQFAEVPQIACAQHQPCRELMAGRWLRTIFDQLDRAANATSDKKMIGYASHTEITLSVMKLLGMERYALPTSAGFLIEYKPTPAPSIRLFMHDPVTVDEHVIYRGNLTALLLPLADSEGFVPWHSARAIYTKYAIAEWKPVCEDAAYGLASNRVTTSPVSTTGSSIDAIPPLDDSYQVKDSFHVTRFSVVALCLWISFM